MMMFRNLSRHSIFFCKENSATFGIVYFPLLLHSTVHISQTSFLKISSGALFKIFQLLNNPIITVSIDIAANNMRTGDHDGVKEAWKIYFASAQLPASERIIPVAAANAPKKKYSSAVMINICLRLAPSVLNNTVSCMR